MPSIINQRRVKPTYTEIPSATVTETDPRVISEMNSKSRKDAEIQRAN